MVVWYERLLQVIMQFFSFGFLFLVSYFCAMVSWVR